MLVVRRGCSGLTSTHCLYVHVKEIVEGRKEMFYLMTHTTHLLFMFIWRERKPAAATAWGTLFNKQQGFFYMHHPTDRITHTTAHVETLELSI